MLRLNEFSAFIFDLDGLVLDTESTYCHAWQATARHLGYDLSLAFCQRLSGLAGQVVEQALMAECGEQLNLAQFKALSRELWLDYVTHHGIAVKTGVLELLAWLQQQHLPYCIATNSRKADALFCLQLAKLAEFFPIVFSRDDVAQGKPAPDLFLLSARHFAIPITRCLVLEDSLTGIQAARQAGAASVFVPSMTPIDNQATILCQLQVNDLAELVTRHT